MSIQSEIDRIRGNVQDTISAIQQTGVTVPEGANSDNLPSLAAALANEKQDKLTGTSGQFVGFNSGGNATAVAAPTAASIGAVPTSRKVNGKALSADVTLSAADVGARADNWTPDAAEVGADPAGTAETKANAVQTNLTSHTNNKSNPHGVTAAQVGALPTSGGTMTGSIKMGEHDITGTATNYGLFFDSMGQVIVKAGDSNSVEVTDMGVTIRSDVGITLDGSVSGISKSSVGLGNVDNTSDANKPISTATQNALNGKQATVTGGASTITSSNLTANRALVSNGSGKVAVSAVTSTELGYLDGVTSNIQTQINAKASTSYVDGLVGDINSALDAINGEVI